MSADILEYVDQKVRDSASSSTEWSILYADDWAKLRAEIVRLRGEVCSCPSGDGSLRWPCKAHPPESIAPEEVKGDGICPTCKAPCKATVHSRGGDWGRGTSDKDRTTYAYVAPQPADGGAVAQRSKFIVDRMVSAFLSWRLPQDFLPDNGVAFAAPDNPSFWPSGTNLLNADQTKAMVEHMLGSAIARDRYSAEEEGDAFTDGYFTGADEAQAHPPAAQVQQEAIARLVAAAEKVCAVSTRTKLTDNLAAALAGMSATNPTGDALGAVLSDLVDASLGVKFDVYHVAKDVAEECFDGKTVIAIADHKTLPAFRSALLTAQAALQHRGDSQEVGRG